uniref:Ion_trans domain-containing protein n=1 Tax=Haemonchus placei TaxID=6290 RepID=A0A0N4X904_HAEPC
LGNELLGDLVLFFVVVGHFRYAIRVFEIVLEWRH